MKVYILPLSDPRADLDTVGGKGMSLARLANAGMPVPDGFHITTEAYRQFVAVNALQAKILAALKDVDISQPATLENASATIGRLFDAANIPDELKKSISDAYLSLDNRKSKIENPKPVAVRSSATAEDLPDASFAGQQETYLNIHGTESVLEAVKKCWASLWTARAIAYRVKNNIDQNSVALAVVVQELVFAEAAGIMFTANPLSGSRGELVINGAWGLGEAVVAGAVTPDTLTLDKQKGRVIRREIAEKLVMTVRTEHGTSEVPISDSQKKKAVLSDIQAMELARLGMRIEEIYAMPMDIEWAMVEGRFAIVQARPITAMPPEPVEWILPNPKAMYARGSLAEHLPNPVSPLFGTLGLRPVNKATGELSDLLNVDFLAHDYQYRVINGYVYMGFVMTAKFALVMIKVAFASLGLMLQKGKQRWREARKTFANVIAQWDEKDPVNLSPTEILHGVRELMYAAGKYYTVIQSGTLPTASSSEIVFTRAYKLASRKNEPKAETLLFGLETVPLRAEKSLFDLGIWVREHPAMCDFILQNSSEKIVAALGMSALPSAVPAQEWDEFKCRLGKHADAFGHTSYEFDFMNPTPAETPWLIIDSIKMYVDGKGSDPYARQREAIAKREQTVNSIQSRFKWIPSRWFNKALKWAMDSGPAREDSLADMGMGHTTIRRLLGELGNRFAANGALENAEDIYWLVEEEVDELASLLARGEKLPDYSVNVPARKTEWHEQMKLVAPPMLPATSRWAKMIPWARENASGNVIKGLGASAGKVTATARVLFAPEDFSRMKQGDVLVAVTTTPAWTPLFTMASAVVTDIGGPLSHSSIVAREYGIPAVLATGVATRRIKDGQAVTVDGSAGTVTLDSA